MKGAQIFYFETFTLEPIFSS